MYEQVYLQKCSQIRASQLLSANINSDVFEYRGEQIMSDLRITQPCQRILAAGIWNITEIRQTVREILSGQRVIALSANISGGDYEYYDDYENSLRNPVSLVHYVVLLVKISGGNLEYYGDQTNRPRDPVSLSAHSPCWPILAMKISDFVKTTEREGGNSLRDPAVFARPSSLTDLCNRHR